MADTTKGSGTKASNTEMVNSLQRRGLQNMEFGKIIKKLNGLKNMKSQ